MTTQFTIGQRVRVKDGHTLHGGKEGIVVYVYIPPRGFTVHWPIEVDFGKLVHCRYEPNELEAIQEDSAIAIIESMMGISPETKAALRKLHPVELQRLAGEIKNALRVGSEHNDE